ncbi:Uncharacterised protein [Mycobacteroides abscessus subsp. abscessus]|nr:Uncharacterised protein [Mycobacteroides abscessus subsp. abscessus]SKT74687.1 Uncharacterised protein [Mycobacteroides abscessus subsp. abscessus]SKW45406.1 Uncharacterised protein [Mycobacteroides abscessus subsp. abscessus]
MPQCVQFVEEQHTRRIAPRDLKDLTHPLFALPKDRMHDIRDTNGIEIGTQFTGHRTGQEGLAAPRRTIQQQAASGRDAKGLDQLGITQRPEQ